MLLTLPIEFGTFVAQRFATVAATTVFSLDIIASVALSVVVVHGRFDGMPRRSHRHCHFALALVIASATCVSAQYLGQSNRNSLGGGLYGTGSNSNSHSVDGYTRNNGTYVAPHQQTNPNNTQMDNYGTRGNYNPYSGQTGTRSPRY